MKPIRDVSIFPSYFRKTCIVAWVVDPAIRDAEFYIYKREDGGGEWKLCNEQPAYGTTWADTSFYIPNKFQEPGYRILAVHGGREYESPAITLFSGISRTAFGVAQNIIQTKYLQARQDGIPVLYYPLVRSGKLSATLDEATGQRLSAPCPDDETDLETYFAQGYYRPFLTFVRLLEDHRTNARYEADGLYDSNVQVTEFLAYPPVRAGDLVVDVGADVRYLVGDGVQCSRLKGIIPISYMGQLERQGHTHPCYKAPIPTNYHDLLRRLTCPAGL